MTIKTAYGIHEQKFHTEEVSLSRDVHMEQERLARSQERWREIPVGRICRDTLVCFPYPLGLRSAQAAQDDLKIVDGESGRNRV